MKDPCIQGFQYKVLFKQTKWSNVLNSLVLTWFVCIFTCYCYIIPGIGFHKQTLSHIILVGQGW